MGDESRAAAAPVEDGTAAAFAALTARCRQRSYREEGIPAMLVLEDLREPGLAGAPAPVGTELDLALAWTLALYASCVRVQVTSPDGVALAAMLEALATRFFFAGDLPDLPSADAD